MSARPAVKSDAGVIDAILDRLVSIEAKVDRLVAKIDRGPRDRDDGRVIIEIAATIGALPFSAAAVIRLAAVTPSLQAALDGAWIDGARSLGKLLRRCEGHTFGGIVLVRVDTTREGIVWCLRAV